MSGWHHANANWKPKKCAVCEAEFTPRSGVNKFCSAACRGKWKYITGQMCTSNQYAAISGNWRRYFARLRQRSSRKATLSIHDLLEKLEQQKGRCALTGEVLTCDLTVGKRTWTNASIDRIEAGGPYSVDNTQLVCAAVNLFRMNLPLTEYVSWCEKVVAYRGASNDKQEP